MQHTIIYFLWERKFQSQFLVFRVNRCNKLTVVELKWQTVEDMHIQFKYYN